MASGVEQERFQSKICPDPHADANSTPVAIKLSVDDIVATTTARTETFEKEFKDKARIECCASVLSFRNPRTLWLNPCFAVMAEERMATVYCLYAEILFASRVLSGTSSGYVVRVQHNRHRQSPQRFSFVCLSLFGDLCSAPRSMPLISDDTGVTGHEIFEDQTNTSGRLLYPQSFPSISV
jgi:hypothetical protein